MSKTVELQKLSFVLQEETVYQYDGEPLTVLCISDVNWNDGDGYVWYDFETDMERISEKFNRQYPEDAIIVYVKTAQRGQPRTIPVGPKSTTIIFRILLPRK